MKEHFTCAELPKDMPVARHKVIVENPLDSDMHEMTCDVSYCFLFSEVDGNVTNLQVSTVGPTDPAKLIMHFCKMFDGLVDVSARMIAQTLGGVPSKDVAEVALLGALLGHLNKKKGENKDEHSY